MAEDLNDLAEEQEVEQQTPEVDGVDDQSAVDSPDESQDEGAAVDQDAAGAEDGENVVTLDGESLDPADEDLIDDKPAPNWVKELRAANRENSKTIKRQEKELEQLRAGAETKPAKLGKEPEMDDDGIDHDPAVFKERWTAWNQQKQIVDAEEASVQEALRNEEQAYEDKKAEYREQKAKLNLKGMEEAEALVVNMLSIPQQQIIVRRAKNKALVVNAIGVNPKRAEELAKITDPIDFAIAINDLDKGLKVEKRSPSTSPERRVVGAAAPKGGPQAELERLDKEAEKTNDYSKVMAHMKKHNL